MTVVIPLWSVCLFLGVMITSLVVASFFMIWLTIYKKRGEAIFITTPKTSSGVPHDSNDGFRLPSPEASHKDPACWQMGADH